MKQTDKARLAALEQKQQPEPLYVQIMYTDQETGEVTPGRRFLVDPLRLRTRDEATRMLAPEEP